jgi:hypothetical protein
VTVIVDKQREQRIAGFTGTVQRALIDAPSRTEIVTSRGLHATGVLDAIAKG